MDQPIKTIYRNWGSVFIALLLILGLPFHILYMMLEMVIEKSEEAPGIIGFSIISVVCIFSLELLWHSFIVMEITSTSIKFRKPWKHFGFFRKSRNSWIINKEEWDELFVYSYRTSYWLYFRKDKTPVFFGTFEDGRKFAKAIQNQYPDKKIYWKEKELTKSLRKKIKKEYPERVMMG